MFSMSTVPSACSAVCILAMDLPYPELWVLEVCVTSDARWLPLAWLVDTKTIRESGLNEQWSCPANGLTFGGLCRLLVTLERRGLIEFLLVVDHRDVGSYVPSDPRILHAMLLDEFFRERGMVPRFHQGGFHYVRITSLGIARWEEYAKPDWGKYRGDFLGRLWEAGESVWSQTAMTEDFARLALDVYAADQFHPAEIHRETAVTTVHEPWQVFPGKWLPRGVTVTVDVTEYAQRSFLGEQWLLVAERYALQKRMFHDLCHWYERDLRHHPDRPRRTKSP
jgi:hypothetical protein